MNDTLKIEVQGGALVLLPAFLPAPAPDLRKVLRWAGEAGGDAAGKLLEWCSIRKDAFREKVRMYDEQQKKTLELFFAASKQRDEERRMLKETKDKKSQEAAVIRQNIKDRTNRMQSLRDTRSDELYMMHRYERELKAIDRNKELIEKWEKQRQLRS